MTLEPPSILVAESSCPAYVKFRSDRQWEALQQPAYGRRFSLDSVMFSLTIMPAVLE